MRKLKIPKRTRAKDCIPSIMTSLLTRMFRSESHALHLIIAFLTLHIQWWRYKVSNLCINMLLSGLEHNFHESSCDGLYDFIWRVWRFMWLRSKDSLTFQSIHQRKSKKSHLVWRAMVLCTCCHFSEKKHVAINPNQQKVMMHSIACWQIMQRTNVTLHYTEQYTNIATYALIACKPQ